MSAPSRVKELASPETSAKTLAFLRDRAQLGHVSISCRTVADGLGVGRETARRALVRLLREGHLVITRHGTGDMYPTTYRIESPS